jgi:predicted nucleic acid-binding protein
VSLIVVDASAAASWLIRSQATVASVAFLQEWPLHDPIAPAILDAETRSVILKAERRGILDRVGADEALTDFRDLAIEMQPPLNADGLDFVVELSRRTGLVFYDALYLDLALRAKAILVTRDAALIAAAARMGVASRDLRAPSGLHEDGVLMRWDTLDAFVPGR